MRARSSPIRTWCPPLAYLAVADPDRRRGIRAALTALGWTVVEHATGAHVVEALSGLILGDAPGPRPSLIVVDAVLPGCTGTTIAAGLRDLGVAIPVVLVTTEPTPLEDHDARVFAVDPAIASAAVAAIARSWPRPLLDMPGRHSYAA